MRNKSGLRAQRRQAARNRRQKRWATVAVAGATTASLGLGMAGEAHAAPLFSDTWGTLGLGHIVGLMGDETVGQYVTNQCTSGNVGSVQVNGVTVDCARSTGNGTAVVLPGGIDLAQQDDVRMTYKPVTIVRQWQGNDIEIEIDLQDKNLLQIASGAAIDPMFGLFNPLNAWKFTDYDDVLTAATAEVEMVTGQVCVNWWIEGQVCNPFNGWQTQTYDKNYDRRKQAMLVIQHLSATEFTEEDFKKPLDLEAYGITGPTRPAEGSATVVGDGTQLALAMTGGTARADAHSPWSIATAGAANGKKSHAQSVIGISNALNTDGLGLTWFGKPIDTTRVDELLTLAEADDLRALAGTQIPAFKEVSCFGAYARASAEGLGSCTNILGTFDYYRDANSGQRQFGITDVTSLVMGGNDALIKQLGDENSEFMKTLMPKLLSADDRLKFANDFIRFTSNAMVDPDTGKTHTAYWLTSDYGLQNPLVIEFGGYQLTFFPAEEINGKNSPNLIGLPQLKKLGAEAENGLLPKISLFEWKNPFGLGTFSLHEPLNPIRTASDFFTSVTLLDDVKNLGPLADLVGDGLKAREQNQQNAATNELSSGLGDAPAESSGTQTADTTPSAPAAPLTGGDLTGSQESTSTPPAVVPPAVETPSVTIDSPATTQEPTAAPTAEVTIG